MLTAVQRPISPVHHRPGGAAAVEGPATWFLVAEEDRMIVGENERFMAERMNARTRSHPSITCRW